jgi:hypothetical protein
MCPDSITEAEARKLHKLIPFLTRAQKILYFGSPQEIRAALTK